MQAFWAQIFVMPKKIIQQVETMRKRFLWKEEVHTKGKALVSQDTLCWPKTVGGLNIIDISVWNKAAILKHMWSLRKKKDKTWVRWIHSFYLKGRNPWQVRKKQASWIVRKIMQVGHQLKERGVSITEVMEAKDFSIKKTYKSLRGEYTKVLWRKLTCNNLGSPK